MCSPADHTNSTTLPFCDRTAMSMTMYMDGFRSSLFAYLFTPSPTPPPAPPTGSNDGALPCLSFLVKGWVLDSPAKFVAAMVLVILLGMAAEGLAALRSGGWVQSWAQTWASQSTTHQSARRTRATNTSQRLCLKLCSITLHILQALIGYLLMLSAMSYSLELLGCALFGLGVGYAAFFFDLEGVEEGAADDVGGGYDDHGYQEVGGDDDAYDGTATPGGGNGGAALIPPTNRPTSSSSSACCDVPGRGPPRRAFRFLSSPVPTLVGGGFGRDRTSVDSRRGGRSGEERSNEDAAQGQVNGLALQSDDDAGDGAADNVSLREDDKMTPLL